MNRNSFVVANQYLTYHILFFASSPNVTFFKSFRPLDQSNQNNIELLTCCSCYPREEDEEETFHHVDDILNHPYLARTTSQSVAQLRGETV